MASLSTCHLELVVWDGNLVKSCNISPTARSFGETERRLVICIDFSVALVLRVGTVGEG